MGVKFPYGGIEISTGYDGRPRVTATLLRSGVWLSKPQIAEIFQTSVSNVNNHVARIFAEGELIEGRVMQRRPELGTDRKFYWLKHYNLQLVCAVAFRVKTEPAKAFRAWVTGQIGDILIKNGSSSDSRTQK